MANTMSHNTECQPSLRHVGLSLGTAGPDPAGFHQALSAQRARKKIAAPHITNARKAFKGNTCKRGRKESRGRRAKYSKKMVLRLHKAR